jgi:hypothetical protein
MKYLVSVLKEFGTIGLAIVSVALSPLFFVGVPYTLLKPLYDYRMRPFKVRLKRLGVWLLNVLYSVWRVIRLVPYYFAYIVDILGNVLIGELIEDIVTAEEETLFGKADVTISAALGDIKKRGKFLDNGIGEKLCDILSKLDFKHEDHCLAAIELYEFKKSLEKR